MIALENDIYFSSKTENMDLEAIFKFVKNSYWGELRTLDEQKVALENSINFGLFHNNEQIAYTRVMTDKILFAYLLDFYVIKSYQGKGLGQLLMDKVLNYKPLNQINGCLPQKMPIDYIVNLVSNP